MNSYRCTTHTEERRRALLAIRFRLTAFNKLIKFTLPTGLFSSGQFSNSD